MIGTFVLRNVVRGVALTVFVALAGCATPPASRTAEDRAQAVIANPIRTDQDRRMDASRNPAQFLPFTGASPGMMVLDVAAGAGYTSQLLVLAVAPDGKVLAQREQPGAALSKRLTDHPQANFVPRVPAIRRPGSRRRTQARSHHHRQQLSRHRVSPGGPCPG